MKKNFCIYLIILLFSVNNLDGQENRSFNPDGKSQLLKKGDKLVYSSLGAGVVLLLSNVSAGLVGSQVRYSIAMGADDLTLGELEPGVPSPKAFIYKRGGGK